MMRTSTRGSYHITASRTDRADSRHTDPTMGMAVASSSADKPSAHLTEAPVTPLG